jgi:ribosome-associated protein
VNTQSNLVQAVVKGIQEKKGKQISVVDMQGIGNAVTRYMVICQGNSPSHVSALSDEIWEQVRVSAGEKPISIDGLPQAQWVAMDYGDVVAHIFLPEQCDYYDLVHLWADAEIEKIADID